MTFIDQNNEQSRGKGKDEQRPIPPGKSNEQLKAEYQNTARDPESIGLVGGQPDGDERGLDVNQYTGPGSRPSGEFFDPEAAPRTGPGNRGDKDQERSDTDQGGNS